MKNGYSISYSVIKPKENSSNLTSFLSQNSLRSNSTMKTIATRMCITPQIKQTGLTSPRSKIITLHESRSPPKSLGRTKFISEHTNIPYLCISKKQQEVRIPTILPKLSPEPKIETSRMPYINIMTEPTAAIEEISDDEKSNADISPKSVQTPKDNSLKNSLMGSQNIINSSNNMLQVSQDDQLSNSRTSLKNRFKQAVQKSFRGIPRKSLFNVLISAEFNAFHEEERKSIHKKIEKGNVVLANKKIHRKRVDNQTKCLKEFSMKKRERFINMEQFTVSTKAFQRKINLIHGASSKNVFCLESFSLFSKNCRKSILSSNQKMLNEIIQPPSEEKSNQEKLNVTIALEGVEQHRFTFSKPNFTSKKMDSSVNEDQQIAQTPNKSHGNFSIFPTPQASKCIRQASSKKLEYLQTKRMTRQSILPQMDDINSRLDLDSDYSKAKLFVRVYYQNKLYKLIQRTNYTKQNLIEIEESFNPKIAQNSTMMTGFYTVMSTTDPGIRQRRVTNEFLDKIQCVPIKLSKYSFSLDKKTFEYDDESLSSSNSSSGDSGSEGSFEKYLESPAYDKSRYSDKLQLEPSEQKKRKSKKQKTIVISQASEPGPLFINDHPTDNKQLSTGSLVLIKKIRKAFQIAIFLQPIISTLEQATKNQLLTFRTPPVIQEFILPEERDQSQRAFEELRQFEKKSYLNRMILQGIEIRYEAILMGRYECQTRMIDVEHQDPPQQIIYEKQDTKCEKIEPQQQIVSTKASNKNSNKDSVRKDSGAKKQQLINSKKQNQSQRHLTKQDSLQVTQPQWNKRAMLSGEISNVQTVQNSNQQNSNLFTQTSTVLITKPTQTSQQSVFRVMSSKHIDLNCSQQDLSSSFHSSQNDETPPSGKIHTQPQQQQLLPQPNIDQGKILSSNRHIHNHRENSIRIDDKRQRSLHQYEHKSELSMYMFSLRMRTHIKESVRRQKLNQLELIKLSIFDHNYTEFMDNIQLIPETQLDSLLQNGDSFLILAAQCGNLEIVKELLRRGAEINHQNDDGNTAVHLAMAYGHYKIADLLIEAGGSTHITNKSGQTAWALI